ncbi:MAG: hypothetical protein ABJB17_09885 [Burkholderiales bacterium]
MSRGTRLARLERTQGSALRPWLSVGCSDRDVADAIGFESCPLRREPGETWDTFTSRTQQWARGKPAFVAHVIYRGDTAGALAPDW